jgi:hypothetical protein
MRAKLDENLPVVAAELLRTAGWECDTVYDEGLAGADDTEVAAPCQAGARVLFTLDLDVLTSGDGPERLPLPADWQPADSEWSRRARCLMRSMSPWRAAHSEALARTRHRGGAMTSTFPAAVPAAVRGGENELWLAERGLLPVAPCAPSAYANEVLES